jgi:hypothetical protein
MKRIHKIIALSIFILVVPLSMAIGQNNKGEQKIKIVVDNGSGEKVVIDTVYKNKTLPDSIKLKDGTFISLTHTGDKIKMKHHSDKDHICIMSSTDSNRDSIKGSKCEKYKVIAESSNDDGNNEKIEHINKGMASGKEIEKSFDISVSDNSKDSKDDNTSYVIARDGIVVTIEGNDDARMKELVNEIRSKLDINNGGKEQKGTTDVRSDKHEE